MKVSCVLSVALGRQRALNRATTVVVVGELGRLVTLIAAQLLRVVSADFT